MFFHTFTFNIINSVVDQTYNCHYGGQVEHTKRQEEVQKQCQPICEQDQISCVTCDGSNIKSMFMNVDARVENKAETCQSCKHIFTREMCVCVFVCVCVCLPYKGLGKALGLISMQLH